MYATTKRDRSIIKNAFSKWSVSNIYNIQDCYINGPSFEKMLVFRNICREAVSRHSYNVRIISYSRVIFTCGYTYKNANGEEIFVYYLPTRTLELPVSEISDG